MQKVNMTQIAKSCGVSLKTVSRVLNHPEQVSEDTRDKVRKAMEEYGFQINLLAKGLRQNHTNIIIVFLDKHNGEYLNSWRNMMLRYLFRHASDQGLKIMVSPSDSGSFMEDETDGFYLLSSGIADGAILFEYADQDKRIEYFTKTNTPFVILGQPREKHVPAVSLDNYDIGYKGGTYLKEKGYQKICFLTNEQRFYSSQMRVKGLLDAAPDAKVIYGVKNPEDAYQQTLDLIKNNYADCIFTNGDNRFLGIYKAVLEMGKKIPEDIAVLSTDNLPINKDAFPSLSSLGQDFDAIAQNCISLLQRLRRKEPMTEAIQIFEPSAILERESTKR